MLDAWPNGRHHPAYWVALTETARLSGAVHRHCGHVKFTRYFAAVRSRPDRALILDAWIDQAVSNPLRDTVQDDGRIRRWVNIPELDNRYPRVILLEDGETVHNAFLDRSFVP